MQPRRSRALPVLALLAVVGIATLAVPQPAPARPTIVVGVPVAPAPVVVAPPPQVVVPAPVIVVPRPYRPHAHRWHHWQRW
jgi:hypothetical protein